MGSCEFYLVKEITFCPSVCLICRNLHLVLCRDQVYQALVCLAELWTGGHSEKVRESMTYNHHELIIGRWCQDAELRI